MSGLIPRINLYCHHCCRVLKQTLLLEQAAVKVLKKQILTTDAFIPFDGMLLVHRRRAYYECQYDSPIIFGVL